MKIPHDSHRPLGFVIGLALVLLAVSGAATASELGQPAQLGQVVKGQLHFDDGDVVDFELPNQEMLILQETEDSPRYGLMPIFGQGEKSQTVQFHAVELLPGTETAFQEVAALELRPGQSGELVLGKELGFNLTLRGIGWEAPLPTDDVTEACIRCTTSCGSRTVRCTVCASGFCCSIYCNGNFRCRVCKL